MQKWTQKTMSVDLVLNCYEKTYQKLLNESYIKSILEQNCFDFTNVFVVVSNVENRNIVDNKLQELVSSNTINGYFFVEDSIDDDLKSLGLNLQDLGVIANYSTWAYTMICKVKSDYFVHWDTDIRLDKNQDWITSSIEVMQKTRIS